MKPKIKSVVALALLVVNGTLDTGVGLLEKEPILLGVSGHSALERAPLDSRGTNTSKVVTECSLHFSWKVVIEKVDDRPSGKWLLYEHTARKDEGRNHYDREITHGRVLVAEHRVNLHRDSLMNKFFETSRSDASSTKKLTRAAPLASDMKSDRHRGVE